MRKKWAFTSVIALSTLIVSACGDTSGSTTSIEDWPDEELTLVVPYSVGGSADRQARALAPYLKEELGVNILAENREGGGGASGTVTHKNSDPDDGTHIIYQSHPHFEAGIVREAGYEFDDFDILGITHSSPITIWVAAESEYETMEDLVRAAESSPGSLSYAMISSSWSDIAVKILMDQLELDIRAVPYDGGGPMRTALMGGEVDFIASDVEGTLAGAGDDLRPLAIYSDEPYEHAPDIPLINDVMQKLGVSADIPSVSNQRFIQVKSEFKENYPERFEKLEAAFESAVTNEEFKEWGENQDMYMTWIPSKEATAILEETVELIYEYEDLFK